MLDRNRLPLSAFRQLFSYHEIAIKMSMHIGDDRHVFMPFDDVVEYSGKLADMSPYCLLPLFDNNQFFGIAYSQSYVSELISYPLHMTMKIAWLALIHMSDS